MPAPSAAQGSELVPELNYVTLSGVVNEVDPQISFLRNLLPFTEQLRSTESVELAIISNSKRIAPFGSIEAEPIQVSGRTTTFRVVKAPQVNISRGMTPSDLMFVRRAGASLYGDEGRRAALARHVAGEFEELTYQVDNLEEWETSQMLRWVIDYSAPDGAAFTVTIPHDSGLDLTLTGAFWDDVTSGVSDHDPAEVDRTLCRALSRLSQLQPGMIVMGSEAADAFEENTKLASKLDNRNINTGTMELQNQFSDAQARYLGRWRGKEVWEYSQQLVAPDGTTYDVIEPKYAYWLSSAPRTEFEFNYGAIPNLKLTTGTNNPTFESLQNAGAVPIRRFADMEMMSKGRGVEGYLQSAPLPFPRRPNVWGRAKVVSG
jgi:hypothetical protein